MNTTCLQCGAILPSGVRVCTFCDSHLSLGPSSKDRDSLADSSVRPVWRGEVASRVASYRARRRKTDSGQPELPFEAAIEQACFGPPRVPPAVAVDQPPAPTDDFSFSVAIGRTASRRGCEDAQMFIDVSIPPAPEGASTAVPPLQDPVASAQAGLYPVASMEERRLSALIDAACLLFACGSFLALFGSLGGHFAFSKLSAAVYAASFTIVYFQYFSLFTVFGGTTPGMMLRGLRVVDFSGEEPSPRQFFLRAAGYMLSAGTFFLGFLWSQWDEDELTWHDRISRTYLSSSEVPADAELSGVAHTH